MRLKTLFQTGLALASLTLIAPQLPITSFLASPAAAAIEVEIGTDQFYDELAPYGDWVMYRGGYVFVPGDVDDRWRPYALGRWVYTDDYGWMWNSDEPFGWATYHYGRWGYGDDLGWYWVPGRVWAPAWVSWRRGPDYVVWAPLPPTYGDDYYDGEGDEDYEVADNDIPDNYWNAVPAASFLAANLAAFIYADDDEDDRYYRRRYIDNTEYLGPVRYRNRMIMNNGLDAGFIERQTKQKVHRYKVRDTDDFRGVGRRDGDTIAIYDRKVKGRPDAKPMKVKNVEDVEQKHGKRWKGVNNNQEAGSKKKGSNQPQFGSGQDQPGDLKQNTNRKKNAKQIDEQSNDGKKLTKKQRREAEKQKKQRSQEFSNQNEQGSTQGQGKKKKRNQNSSNQEQLGVMDSQGGESSNQGKKKKRNQNASGENSQNSEGFSNQQGKKKKRNQNASGENSQNSDGQQEKKKKRSQTSGVESDGQSQSGNNKKRKKNACDPDTGANC
jgi:hypothetical protein